MIIDGNITLQNQGVINVENGGYMCIRPNSILNLIDVNSYINLLLGCYSGVNALYVTSISNCVTNLSSVVKTGNGQINDYNTDLYIQNQTICFGDNGIQF